MSEIQQESVIKCGRCNGTGKSSASISEGTCPDCHGSGHVEVQ